MLLWLLAVPSVLAATPTFPDLAERAGLAAVAEALQDEVATAKNDKKLQVVLAQRRLAEVALPLRPTLGADLVLQAPSPLAHCAWSGTLVCRAAARTKAVAGPHELICANKFGATLPLSSRQTNREGAVLWTVEGVERCWALGGVRINVRPAALPDLEGVGQGSELIPPELTGLTVQEVDALISGQAQAFRHCYQQQQRHSEAGSLRVAYQLAPEGGRAQAQIVAATFHDEAVERCILERFGRIPFPPTRGGYAGGTTAALVFQ